MHAYRFLRQEFGSDAVTPDAWVSEIRLKVLPLVAGELDNTSDGHGFDFRFSHRGKRRSSRSSRPRETIRSSISGSARSKRRLVSLGIEVDGEFCGFEMLSHLSRSSIGFPIRSKRDSKGIFVCTGVECRFLTRAGRPSITSDSASTDDAVEATLEVTTERLVFGVGSRIRQNPAQGVPSVRRSNRPAWSVLIFACTA